MNISANNYSPIKPQASFGKEYEIEDAEHIAKLTEELKDSFNKDCEDEEKKSKAGIFASVAGAILTTFVIGKCAASKVMTAFPKLCSKLTGGLRKGANFVRNSADDILNGKKLPKSNKFVKNITKQIARLEKKARELFVKITGKSSTENVVSTAVGVAAASAVAPEIIKVDSNNDDIPDIAQRNVNAYKNAAQKIGIVSEVVGALS